MSTTTTTTDRSLAAADLAGYSGEETAAQLRERLEHAELPEAAIRAMLRETAPERHRSRIDQARCRALEMAADNTAPHPDMPPSTERIWCAVQAVAFLVADAMGIGGRDGVEGLATARLPGLDSLGTGRKQAGDGPAWSSAIEWAAWQLAGYPERAVYVAPEAADYGSPPDPAVPLRWSPPPEGSGADLVVECDLDGEIRRVPVCLPTPWLYTVAREGLRLSLGLDGWHRYPRHPIDFFAPATPAEERRRSAPGWARLVAVCESVSDEEMGTKQTSRW